MSIQRLPSGRYRAQVYDPSRASNVSVSRILPDCRGTFATRAEAAAARELARSLLKRPGHWKPLDRKPLPRTSWCIASKGESQCRACGAPATCLHHIVPRIASDEGRRDWDRNGLPLCKPCHRGWHNRIVDLPHEILSDAEFRNACKLMSPHWVAHHYVGHMSAEERWARVKHRQFPKSRLALVLEAA